MRGAEASWSTKSGSSRPIFDPSVSYLEEKRLTFVLLSSIFYLKGKPMQFEWDEQKAKTNLQKHKMSFLAATAVFDDPNRIEEDSTRPEQGEIRTKTIGKIEEKLVVVVISTDREQKRRIISARRAGKNEREKYYHS